MNDLKSLKAQLAEVRRAQAGIAAKLGDIAAERHDIEAEVADRAATLEAADMALVAALAARELGDDADVEGAQKALADARLLAQNAIEPSQRLRVIDALRQRHESEHQVLHGKGIALMASIRTAEAEALVLVANGIYNDCETALEQLAMAEPRLLAVRALLNEYGRSWHLPQLSEAVVRSRFNITPNQARASVLADLNADPSEA